jgi:hypothetical protein
MKKIVLGMREEDSSEFSIFLGRKLSENHELKEDVYLDVNSPHMILIAGKRGTGKSHTLSAIMEGLACLPEEARNIISLVVVDTMGIFWSLQVPNLKEVRELSHWGIDPKEFDVRVFYPEGLKENYSKYSEYFHEGFKIYPSELTLSDWMFLFNLKEVQAQISLLSKVLDEANEKFGKFYAISDLIMLTEKQSEKDNIKEALLRKLQNAKSWGIFSNVGKTIEEIVKPGRVAVLDFSGAGILPWNVRITLTAILIKKIYSKRSFARDVEEIQRIRKGKTSLEGVPLVWLFIDEAQLFVPNDSVTAASDPIIEWVKQGRRPGLSLVMATQQPGALDLKVLSQTDILIVHRITAGKDAEAIQSRISEIYGSKSISSYMQKLPKAPGYAIVIDDQTEGILPIKVRPKQSYHAGGSARIDDYIVDIKKASRT